MLPALMKKELLALSRDVHGLAALFLMPVLFIVVMSLALKDVYSPAQRSLRYSIDARDTGPGAQALVRLWRERHGEPQPLPADWRARLRSGKLQYVIVLDEQLSVELSELALPRKAYVHLLAEPGLDANLFNALHAELGAVAGELKAHFAMQSIGEAGVPGTSMGKLVSATRAGPRPNSVQQNVPAWLVFGMFFVVASLASLFVQEQSCGALARLHGLGVPRSVMLASKALPYLAVNALQALLMLAVGVWLVPTLGGDALTLAGIDWLALTTALTAIALAAVCMALALACVVRTHAQAAAVGPILNVLMAAIGGIMVPQFVMPAFMQRLAEWSPMNWGLEALLDVLLRGGGVGALLPELLLLAAFAASMLLLAFLLFPKPLR